MQISTRLPSRSWNRDSQGKLSPHCQSWLNFFMKTLILNSHSQPLRNMIFQIYKSSANLVHFTGNFSNNISFNFDASIINFSILKVILQCTLSVNQTCILEDLRVSYQISTLLFPQISHSFSRLFSPDHSCWFLTYFSPRPLIFIMDSQFSHFGTYALNIHFHSWLSIFP